MNRREMVLVGLAPARGALHSPVQVQKLFFLIDKNIPHLVYGPHFNFAPYDYGPFDRAVYDALRDLVQEGLVDTVAGQKWVEYRLTVVGQVEADKLLGQLPSAAQAYLERLSVFVRSLSFTQLVSAIYKAYPEMRVNSVFQD